MNDELLNLSKRVLSGAIKLEYGLQQARTLPEECDFTAENIHPLAVAAIDAAKAGGQSYHVCVLWRIVLEALDHARTPSQKSAARGAASAWINIVTNVLFEVADGRILADARSRGERLARTLLSEGDHEGASLLFFQLGVMLLDPYIERRDTDNFLAQAAAWARRGREKAFDLMLGGRVGMPPPEQALSDAGVFLEHSARLRSGRERGKSLKALAEAYYWKGAATARFDRPTIETAIREALRLLHPTQDATARAQLGQYMRGLGVAKDSFGNVKTEDAEDSQIEQQFRGDPRGFIHALEMRADAASTPDEAIRHLLTALRFASQSEDDEARARLIDLLSLQAWRKYKLSSLIPDTRRGVSGAVRFLLRRLLAKREPAGEKWRSARLSILARAKARGWPPADLGLALLALATRTSTDDSEDVGLELITEALGGDLSQAPDIKLALETARVQLSWRFAVTHVDHKRWTEAFCQYMQAVHASLAARMPQLARENFQRAEDVFPRLEHPGEPSIIASLAASLPGLQAELGAAEGERVREIWRKTIRDAAFVSNRLDELARTLQAAKGASLSIAREGHQQRSVLAVPSVQKALQEWREKRSNVGPTFSSTSLVDQDQLLSAYADDSKIAGTTTNEELDNLARQFDRLLITQLARGVQEADSLLLTEDEIKARLPDKTVLVSIFACPTADWSLGFVTLLATREGVHVRRARTNEPMDRTFGVDGLYFDHLAPVVASLRKALQNTRDTVIATEETHKLLGGLFTYAFRSVEEDLAELYRRGYRHLCVNPCGALHFCPMALVGKRERPLADEWIVTHLPSLGLLRWQGLDVKGPSQREGASVFGLGFATRPHGLEPLPAATEEARRIAGALQGELFLDADATAARFNDALRRNRFVHVATHGSQDAAAPAFQTLFFHPDQDHDGIYHAFEVLQHQLRGLDCVTLSACETALGRIDVYDNARGLQAFLFTAGAATIVSCLWPVADRVAALFFERFYGELAAGQSKVEAFGKAQRAAREEYPGYRDWGAFQYSGAW